MPNIDFIALAFASFIFALTPGPGVVAVLATSISRGTAHGVAMSVGEVCSDMVYLLVAIISLASMSAGLADFLFYVRILGAGYLAWMGVRQMLAPPMKAGQAPVTTGGLITSFSTGMLISITNPKVILFYLLFLPLFLDLSVLDLGTGAMVMVVMFISVLAGPLVFVVIGKKARDIATGDISGRWLNRITGLLLIGVAVAMVVLV
ncbi:MAG: LysE family translocator [Candidatus Puniceispirillales bacterium]